MQMNQKTKGYGSQGAKDSRSNNQHDGQDTLGECRRLALVVARQEEERREADHLDVQANKDVLDGLGEEESSRISGSGLVHDIQEQVRPHLVEQEE